MSGYVIYQYSGSATNLNIYTTLDGKRVTDIHGNWGGCFQFNSSITHVTGDSILKIRDGSDSGGYFDGAFALCSNLTTANFKNCSYIGAGAFNSCSALTSVNFPNCSCIGTVAFAWCSSLSQASFPDCNYIGSGAFSECSSLTTVSFPNCSYIGDYVFYSCTSLTSVSFPNCSYIDGSAFYDCSLLSQIYLMSNSICTLLTIDAFCDTGITSSTGSIIVPTSLVSGYKSASAWSYFSNRIFGA